MTRSLRRALRSRVRRRREDGFALVEMLIALVVINVALLALLLTLTSGVTAVRRSAQTSTAAAVADKQLERYRAVAFASIYLDTASLSVAATDPTYSGDAAYSATQISQTCSPLVAVCTPSQTVTGPDGRSYRVDTYVVGVTPPGGTQVKQVTVVVRAPGGTATLARVVSTAGVDF